MSPCTKIASIGRPFDFPTSRIETRWALGSSSWAWALSMSHLRENEADATIQAMSQQNKLRRPILAIILFFYQVLPRCSPYRRWNLRNGRIGRRGCVWGAGGINPLPLARPVQTYCKQCCPEPRACSVCAIFPVYNGGSCDRRIAKSYVFHFLE